MANRFPAHLAKTMQAAAAQASGSAFQAELDRMHERWRALGFAQFQRQNVATMRRGREVRVVGKSGVDYVGVVNGHAVAYDAKVRSGLQSLALLDRRGTEENEVLQLEGFARAGATTFLLVQDPELFRAYVVGPAHYPTLLRGDSVALRERLTISVRRPPALVPCVEWPDQQRMVRALGSGIDLWDWTSLFPYLSLPRGHRDRSAEGSGAQAPR